jgi:hypothetical protein
MRNAIVVGAVVGGVIMFLFCGIRSARRLTP